MPGTELYVKLPPATPTVSKQTPISVPAALLAIQLPAESAWDSSRGWPKNMGPSAHAEDSDEAPGFGLAQMRLSRPSCNWGCPYPLTRAPGIEPTPASHPAPFLMPRSRHTWVPATQMGNLNGVPNSRFWPGPAQGATGQTSRWKICLFVPFKWNTFKDLS